MFHPEKKAQPVYVKASNSDTFNKRYETGRATTVTDTIIVARTCMLQQAHKHALGGSVGNYKKGQVVHPIKREHECLPFAQHMIKLIP